MPSEYLYVCVCRISAAGQMDRRDSMGVCIDSESGEGSLQRDQAVCISTNGTLTLSLTGSKHHD